jgi:hypothetical protein
MSSRSERRGRGKFGRVVDVRFAEVEVVAPSGRGVAIEVEGGLRLLVSDEVSLELAAQLLNRLGELGHGARGRKGGGR